FDDTNPSKETVEFEESIQRDVRWLGFDWDDRIYYASDYSEQLYQYSVQLIKDGNAYVDSLSADEIREYRGTLTQPGKNSPYRNRSVEENLALFERRRAGTLEFEDHRPLYDWCLEKLPVPSRPVQIEFARLNLSYTVLSKRKLLTLVTEGLVNGWDDPRMPTLSGLRRRGYTPEAIRNFCDSIGVAKRDAIVDVAQLEHAIRDDLNKRSQRVMAVSRPLRCVIENYPEGQTEELNAVNN